MDVEARLALIEQVGEEIVTREELRGLLEQKSHPIAYDGFEPSGAAHIAQGVMRAININKMIQAGCRFKMFVADWHAWANNKMGGDLERIQTTGKYLIEIWRATGMDLENVEFVWASEFIEDETYWKTVMNIARDTSLDRVLRTTQIMGRSEKDKLSASQILYPCMQAADIFHLKADITQLGMDQRKVNMLAREVGPKLGFWKPVVVSHHMLMGLGQPPANIPSSKEELEGKTLEDVKGLVGAIADEFESPAWIVTMLRTLDNQIRQADSVRAARAVIAMTDDALESGWKEYESRFEELPEQDPVTGKWSSAKNLSGDLAVKQSIHLWLDDALGRLGSIKRRWEQAVQERATAMKMSKSNPDSAIFMTDTPEQVAAKMKKAYCPEKQVVENPILEYYRYIVFERFNTIKIERPSKFGGDIEFESYDALAGAFEKGDLHPADAKSACATYVNQLLEPVRKHFETNPTARDLKARVEAFERASGS